MKPDTSDDDVKAYAYLIYLIYKFLTLGSAKKNATDQGGKIVHEYTLFKGFSYVFNAVTRTTFKLKFKSVTFPEDAVNTLESNPHVQAVEVDKEVKTQ